MEIHREIRQAVRQLRSAPSFAVPAVLVLGLGLGAAIGMFSVVNAVLLRPLVPDQDRVVVLFPRAPSDDRPFQEISLPEFRDWRDGATTFQELAAFSAGSGIDSLELEDGRRIDVRLIEVTPAFFDTLGQRPLLGRGFENADELPRAERVLVLGHSVWRNAFGGDPAILGTTLRFGARSEDVYTVVGVMPRGFEFPNQTQGWIVHPSGGRTDDRGVQFLLAIGRLAPGVTRQEAEAEMEVLDERLLKETGRAVLADRRVQAVPVLEFFLGASAPAVVLILQVAVLLLLLVACVNVSGLLLSRNNARHRELSVRAALGATRSRIARALLVEAGLVTLAGGALGLLLAHAALAAIVAYTPSGVPRLGEARLELTSYVFAVLISAAAAGFIGIATALRTSRQPLSPSRAGDTPEMLRARRHLIATEVAAAVVLVLGASLMLGSLVRLMQADFGYRPEKILMLYVDGPQHPLESPGNQRRLLRALMDRLEVVPGVDSAAAVLVPPFAGGKAGWDAWFVAESEGHGFVPREQIDEATGKPATYFTPAAEHFAGNPSVNWEVVSGNYFETMGISLLSGRTFTDADSDDAASVVIVGKSFAERVWPGQDPIGKRILTLGHRFDEERRAVWQTVVGVVADARYREIESSRLDVYVPYLQSEMNSGYLVLRTTGDPPAVLPSVRAAVNDIGPGLYILSIRTLEAAVSRELLPWRFQTALLTAFAAAALLITAVGIFGLLAHSVGVRSREIGLRMALGARQSDVLSLIVRQGMRPLFLGLAFGLVLSYFSAQTLAAHLYETAPTDAATYSAVALLMVLVGLAAAYVPARRAACVDPVSALKHE